jgi:ubiquinone/menaquinone biosynthesis C-methylase UbiE
MRALWNARTESWHDQVHAAPGFDVVRTALLGAARPGPGDHVVDLGAGSGFITLALAREVCSVEAVDVSEQMLDRLRAATADEGIANVHTRLADLTQLVMPDGSVDVVVSSYALHHLTDADKVALVARARRWLRPGGRLVVADMMFGRGRTREDRAIIGAKARALLRKGPGGVWRLAKNVVRFGLRSGTELPASPDFWVAAFERAGFLDVRFTRIIAEAGLVSGTVPHSGTG